MPAPGVSPHPDSRFGRISGTQAAFGHLKGNVLKLCQVSGECTYEEFKKLEKFQKNLNEAQKEINRMRKVMTR